MHPESELLSRLRSGDERAFTVLVERYHEPMLGLAASFVPSRAVAEEVVQDTWLAALRGLDAFEGRSSLKTWLFRILVNRARSTGSKEQRSIPVADPEPAVDPSRFGGDGGWADPPEHWIEAAERRIAAGKLAGQVRVMDRRTSGPPARGGAAPRRRGDEQRGCLRGARPDRGKPAGPAAPRPSRLRQLLENELREVR